MELFAITLEEIYALTLSQTGGDIPDLFPLIANYRKICTILSVNLWRDAEKLFKKEFLPEIDRYIAQFRAPEVLMRKREKKRLDHDRAQEIKSRGEVVSFEIFFTRLFICFVDILFFLILI